MPSFATSTTHFFLLLFAVALFFGRCCYCFCCCCCSRRRRYFILCSSVFQCSISFLWFHLCMMREIDVFFSSSWGSLETILPLCIFAFSVPPSNPPPFHRYLLDTHKFRHLLLFPFRYPIHRLCKCTASDSLLFRSHHRGMSIVQAEAMISSLKFWRAPTKCDKKRKLNLVCRAFHVIK